MELEFFEGHEPDEIAFSIGPEYPKLGISEIIVSILNQGPLRKQISKEVSDKWVKQYQEGNNEAISDLRR